MLVLNVCADYPPSPHDSSFPELPYLGLRGHKFFIPNPKYPIGAGMNDNIIVRNQKRVRAVRTFFRNLAFGSPVLNYKLDYVIDPEEAKQKWRPEYVRKFGYRGQRLIDFLGSGPTRDQIVWSLGTVY